MCNKDSKTADQIFSAATALFTDQEKEDFENTESLSHWSVVGIPDGPAGDAQFTRTNTTGPTGKNTTVLAFKYTKQGTPAPALFHLVLLRDFKRISFWIKSEASTTWVLAFEDNDKAVFAAFVECAQATWQKVELTPDDFQCTEDSPVKKAKLDASCITYGYAAFDLQTLWGGGAENTVCLDDINIIRSDYHIIKGDYLLNGELKTISEPTYIQGNLYLINNAELEVSSTRLIVDGEIGIDNGRLSFKNGFLHIKQNYRGEHIVVIKNGAITITHSELLSEYDICGAAIEQSQFTLAHVDMLMSGFSFSTLANSTLLADHVSHGGEFIIFENSACTLKNSSGIIFWICTAQELYEPLVYPAGDTVDRWQTPPALTNNITVNNCSGLLYGFIAKPGCNITLKDSKIRALGFLFKGSTQDRISDLKNQASFVDYPLKTKVHTLYFTNSSVQSWNFYTEDTARLTIENCEYGESISMKDSVININKSVCDGSGGYLGASGRSQTIITDSEINCMVLAQEDSRMVFKQSAINGSLITSGQSVISLYQTTHSGAALRYDQGKIVK
ncbi:MAG: hypothetical protein JW822_13055 [Spirochaetales bacterium]|nr:hypothetical protein [Spirochaetales bacterium]